MEEFLKEEYITGIKRTLTDADMLSTCGWQNTLVIGDMHFGVKNGSLRWIAAQKKLFEYQIFPIIEKAKELNISHIVFLGDMFDIRSSTNTYIGVEVKELIRRTCIAAAQQDVLIYIIAGNHDFYSPDVQFAKYNSYDVLFGTEFIQSHPNLTILTDGIDFIYKRYENSNSMCRIALMPWYETANKEKFLKNLNYIYKENSNSPTTSSKDVKPVCGVYAHADMINASMDPDLYKALKNVQCPFWSGHVHYLVQHDTMPLYNIGACMQYNYSDAGQDRFIYIINEPLNKKISIKNVVTPKFSVVDDEYMFDEDIFSLHNKTEFLELRILSDNISKKKYIDRIQELRLKLSNTEIRVKTVFSVISSVDIDTKIKMYSDIDDYIEENTPERLKPALSYIKNNV